MHSGKASTTIAANAAIGAQVSRGGTRERVAISTTVAHAAATSARPTVTNSGSSSATASRVIGMVIPKMITPIAPSASPVRSAALSGEDTGIRTGITRYAAVRKSRQATFSRVTVTNDCGGTASQSSRPSSSGSDTSNRPALSRR